MIWKKRPYKKYHLVNNYRSEYSNLFFNCSYPSVERNMEIKGMPKKFEYFFCISPYERKTQMRVKMQLFFRELPINCYYFTAKQNVGDFVFMENP